MCIWVAFFREGPHYVREPVHHLGATHLAACYGRTRCHARARPTAQQADPMKGLSSLSCVSYQGTTLGLSLGHRDAPQQEEYCDEDVEQAAGD